MSIEPCHIGGYKGYLKPKLYVRIGCGYIVKRVGYRGWEERKLTLAHFRQMRSAFHPEAGEYAVFHKCHQLRYLIRSVNDAACKEF